MSVLWCGVALLISVDVVLAVWRYSNNMESRIAINTRNTLRLEYEGDSLLQWIVPEPCTVSSLTSPSVTLSCPVRGMYTIYPRVLNQACIFLLSEGGPTRGTNFSNFASDDEEYFDDENANIIQKDVLRIWILDPEKASSAELNNKAEVPSLSSRVLTKEFHNLGQDLVLYSYPIAHLYNTMFNPAEGALLLTDFGTFISHDGFITVEELKIVPTEIQHQEQNKEREPFGDLDHAAEFVHAVVISKSLDLLAFFPPPPIVYVTGFYCSAFRYLQNWNIATGCPKLDHKLNILIKMVNNLILFGVVGTNALVKLHVYSGLKYLGIVDANYIIWEEHGRTDFYYNATMKQAGCLREAQTWKAMLELYYGDYKHRDSIWGPENYRSCYETPGLIRDMDRPYEILNLSNNVFITWPTDHTGIYLFTVKILDPNYSFCKLTAHFAVETYGVLKRKDTTIVVSVVWSFIFILLCSFGYSYYKYMNIFGEMLYFNKNQSYS
ncbi:cation channel sperm-associated auxiliary subunit epsilon-like [Pristis pectinata]|uniref:cation channel sperm-associated auxiliary subunit epsilon-like n=1 Tax=Pristis pectinata TaxID=685728 RepID=UPI00223E0E84|nr:cation channel sperm-associated auxiliary subunit epsilon-like [Pristis pectinata]